jgi:hypothetical protein
MVGMSDSYGVWGATVYVVELVRGGVDVYSMSHDLLLPVMYVM